MPTSGASLSSGTSPAPGAKPAHGVECELLGHVAGSEKYLGGVLGADGCVYAVPGKAPRVLKIVPKTGEVVTIGPAWRGSFKWLRGVRCGHKIYCIPCHHERVLKIDTSTGEVALIGDSYAGLFKWHGAVVAADGCSVFCIPQKAERVLRIDATSDTTSLIGPSLGAMHNKWYGGLRSPDGAIWGVPTNASACLKIVPHGASATVSLVGSFSPGGYKWHGGVVAPDGCVWGIPANADTLLRIVPGGGVDGEDIAVQISGPILSGQHRTDGKYKYLGAVLARDGSIICFPSDADFVLRIDTETGSAHTIGGSLRAMERIEQNKWQNGFLGLDGCVYGIPLKAESILRVVPETGEVSTIQPCGPLVGLNKWEGGVEVDGVLFCMPLKARSVLSIAPPRDGRDAERKQPATLGDGTISWAQCMTD
ncbi:hypothetical protein KFE25_007186 [Diacronema lutheri]|uniref:Uncharacterized protein n=2 Tax=Diacronema lutheri TaxID=2081491 RepID=A0A8J5XQ48_DIALT|nr:hypothetical protein KFE25_007186 [Diacronema lutheri]